MMLSDVGPVTKVVCIRIGRGYDRTAVAKYLPQSYLMPCCNQSYTFKTVEEVPSETTPCPCGADWSWLVEYEKEA